jgi:hypothetical protein
VHWNSLARMERGEMTISEPVSRLIRLLARHGDRGKPKSRAKGKKGR